MNGSHKSGFGTGESWNMAKMGLLIFFCLYAFFSWTGDFVQPLGSFFALLMALAVTVYTLMAGKVIRNRFQTSNVTLLQLLTLFLLGHFLPFVLDDVGNGHLFYGERLDRVFYYTLPGLLNYILCGVFLTRDQRKTGAAGTLLWRLAVAAVIFVNPFQAVILLSLFCVELGFALLAVLWNIRTREKGRTVVREFLAGNRETILWILVWCVAVILELSGIWKRNLPGEIVGSTGLFDALRTFRESVLNMVPMFHGSILAINLAAVFLALFYLIRHRETDFLCWQVKMLLCMGVVAVCLAVFGTVAGDRYLVRPEVKLAWMGWLLMMTVSSLAYLVKQQPKAGWLLPLLTYMAICETILNFRGYGIYTLPQALSVGFWG